MDKNSLIPQESLPSGLYPVIIYNIIKETSCENHKITIDDIRKELAIYWHGDQSASANLNRTIKRNLATLLYYDTRIQAEYKDGTPFIVGEDEKIGKIYQLWYEQELSHTDLQLLSDAVIYSKHIPMNQKRSILEKLFSSVGESSPHNKWFHIVLADSNELITHPSKDLYRNLEYINDAIQNQYCLSFEYTYNWLNDTRLPIRTYKSFSPYRIIITDGIYYVIGSLKDTLRDKHNQKRQLTRFEIHKLLHMTIDNTSIYYDICETKDGTKKLYSYINGHYNIYNKTLSTKEASNNINLKASARGVDTLLEIFGNNLNIRKTSELNQWYVGDVTELKYYYSVTIQSCSWSELKELVYLLFSFPKKDLTLISHKELLFNLSHKISSMIRNNK